MFRVAADGLEAYFAFDPKRRADLEKLDKLIRAAAPSLERYFHEGTPAGEPGMRMKMIGYGSFRSANKSGKTTLWPIIGVALQKNYISVYLSIAKQGKPIVDGYAGRLGKLRTGRNNFSFERFDDLDRAAASVLFAEAAAIFKSDADNPVRFKQAD